MAGGYLTENGFVPDLSQETAPLELVSTTPCGAIDLALLEGTAVPTDAPIEAK